MPFASGARLAVYEVLELIDAGGMRACGYAVPTAEQSRRQRISVSSRRGWGPAANEEKLAPSLCR
jgi:hypothetical protein